MPLIMLCGIGLLFNLVRDELLGGVAIGKDLSALTGGAPQLAKLLSGQGLNDVLHQLVDDGYVEQQKDEYFISWDAIYDLLAHPDSPQAHHSSKFRTSVLIHLHWKAAVR